MKKSLLIPLCAALIGCVPFTSSAQTDVWMPSINNNINNTIDTLRTQSLLNLRGGRAKSPEMVRGEAIIKAGRAKTSFTSSPAATALTVKKLTFDSSEPQDAPGQMRHVQNQVERFNKALTRYGLNVNDVADAFLGAYALSYEAAYDKTLKSEDILFLRRQYRQDFLRNSHFQGDSDVNKQVFYELKAIMAIQAIEWRERARQAPTAKERADAEKKAIYYTQDILKK